MDLDGTIVALGSPLAPSSRAIVRLSGYRCREILGQLFETSSACNELAASSATYFGTHCQIDLRHSLAGKVTGSQLPVGCYWWPTSRSYTGEPCAELHVVGSLPIAESLVDRILKLGARNAERGEFTLRSFLAGKIDLAQAEAVLGVIEADHDAEMEWALGQLGGNLSRPVKELRDELLEMTAHLEAGLDFVEEDIEFISQTQVQLDVQRIRARISEILNSLALRSTRTRNLVVTLVGTPNAGKSSLFNALLSTSRAIVSDQAGTTRDSLTEHIRLGQHDVELVDTAGIESISGDSPRSLAQQALQDRVQRADVLLFCQDLSRPAQELKQERDSLESLFPQRKTGLKNFVLIGTKRDLFQNSASLRTSEAAYDAIICSTDDADIEQLKVLLTSVLQNLEQEQQSSAMHQAVVRSKASLERADAALKECLNLLDMSAGEELLATELRSAISELSEIIGEVHTEDLLGQIFSRFCIGK